MTHVSIPEVNMFKNSSTLAVYVPINLSITLALVSANGHRETYMPKHKSKRMETPLRFLQGYHDDSDEFLDRIITRWNAHMTPETKQQSMHWRHSEFPFETKLKQTMSARKVMFTVERLVPIPGGRFLRHRDTKVGPTV